MLLFWWAGSLASSLLTDSFVYSRLRTDADSLVAAIDFPELDLDQPRLGESRLNPAYEEPFSGKYYVIKLEEPSGEITSRSAWEQALPVPELAAGQLRKEARRVVWRTPHRAGPAIHPAARQGRQRRHRRGLQRLEPRDHAAET